MTDAKLPKLAEGSRWVGKGIIDSSGDSVAVHGGQSDAGSFFAALEKLEALL